MGGGRQQVVGSYCRLNAANGKQKVESSPLRQHKYISSRWYHLSTGHTMTAHDLGLHNPLSEQGLLKKKKGAGGTKLDFAILTTNCPFLSAFLFFLPHSIIPPVPLSAVCYNWQIRAQTASWRGEMWHKAREPCVSRDCNDYNRWLIRLLPLMYDRRVPCRLLTSDTGQTNE